MAKCKVCKSTYTAVRPMQQVCSIECAIDLSRMKAEKAQRKSAIETRKQTRLAKEKLKTRGDYIREAQIQVNRFVRIRDRLAGHGCICCDRTLPWDESNKVDAGHYRSTGSAPNMRFMALSGNINAQLVFCNRWRGGKPLDQRERIASRYGQDYLDAIDADQTSRKYTVSELIEIRDGFREWANELAKKIPTI